MPESIDSSSLGHARSQELLHAARRFFMILCPASRKDGKSRIVAIGKKHLPSVPKRERLFGALPAALHAA